MKKTVLFLVLALMVSTCFALPRTNYRKANIKSPSAIREAKLTETTEAVEMETENSSAQVTSETESEYETYIYNSDDKEPTPTPSYTGTGSTRSAEIQPSSTPSDHFAIKGISISIGDSITAIEDKLGKPVNTIYMPVEYDDEESAEEYEPVTNTEGETETTTARPLAVANENAYGYDGFTIYTNDSKTVEKIEVTDPSIPSLKGESPIGMQVFSLADLYGGPVSVEGNIYKFAGGNGTYMYFDAPGGVVKKWGICG